MLLASSDGTEDEEDTFRAEGGWPSGAAAVPSLAVSQAEAERGSWSRLAAGEAPAEALLFMGFGSCFGRAPGTQKAGEVEGTCPGSGAAPQAGGDAGSFPARSAACRGRASPPPRLLQPGAQLPKAEARAWPWCLQDQRRLNRQRRDRLAGVVCQASQD